MPSWLPLSSTQCLNLSPPLSPKAPPPAPAAKTEVTGNLALGLEDGITPSELYDARVEEMITTRFSKLDETECAALLAAAPVHPEYESYCRAVKLEVGGEDDEWKFGRDEPFLDMVGCTVGTSKRRKQDPQHRLSSCSPCPASPKPLQLFTLRSFHRQANQPLLQSLEAQQPAQHLQPQLQLHQAQQQ